MSSTSNKLIGLSIAITFTAAGAGCGGALNGSGTESDSGAQDTQTEEGSPVGWTQCTAPDGVSVCGGPADCPVTTACGACAVEPPSSDVEPCVSAASDYPCVAPADGDVCVSVDSVAWLAAPYNEGVLFASNGAASRTRYSDLGLWTGDPLPTPTDCPSVSGFQLCGGTCGPCAADRTCTGRSPLHPYGICGLDYQCGAGYGGCPSGESCFEYVVQPDAQALADQHGFCIPSAECQAASGQYPGGSKCAN
jgi:hypothetical protein